MRCYLLLPIFIHGGRRANVIFRHFSPYYAHTHVVIFSLQRDQQTRGAKWRRHALCLQERQHHSRRFRDSFQKSHLCCLSRPLAALSYCCSSACCLNNVVNVGEGTRPAWNLESAILRQCVLCCSFDDKDFIKTGI